MDLGRENSAIEHLVFIGPGRDCTGRRGWHVQAMPGEFSNGEGSAMNENNVRPEFFEALLSLSEAVPEMRIGRLIAAVGELCTDLHVRGLWDAADTETLEAIWQFRRNFEAAPAQVGLAHNGSENGPTRTRPSAASRSRCARRSKPTTGCCRARICRRRRKSTRRGWWWMLRWERSRGGGRGRRRWVKTFFGAADTCRSGSTRLR